MRVLPEPAPAAIAGYLPNLCAPDFVPFCIPLMIIEFKPTLVVTVFPSGSPAVESGAALLTLSPSLSFHIEIT